MTSPLPAYLTLIPGGFAARPVPLAERGVGRRSPANGAVVLDRPELFQAVERIGRLAPNAPLSFLVVRVAGLADLDHDQEQLAMRLVAGRVRAMTRATDVVGRMGGASLGVLLQGTGLTAAGATAARLSYHVSSAARAISPALDIRVSAATGTGLNWNTLPVAAANSLPDCG
jgi:GGDEF domain-containing protein